MLKSAIFNLIENSCKFSPAQTANVQLTGSAGELQLAVHNTGPAIPPDQQEVIFIPFQRARNASGKQGFGIGLPLTKRIVELHKGQLALTSTAEAGTTFTIRITS
nr:ATP-binding protein [uncultured Arsenicibacter sp.]